jgi:CO/xanthine dehydrogenase Mo-binding subunit
MDGPAPAIVNAIEHATGVSINRIPATPEVLMEAMEREEPDFATEAQRH